MTWYHGPSPPGLTFCLCLLQPVLQPHQGPQLQCSGPWSCWFPARRASSALFSRQKFSICGRHGPVSALTFTPSVRSGPTSNCQYLHFLA